MKLEELIKKLEEAKEKVGGQVDVAAISRDFLRFEIDNVEIDMDGTILLI